MGQIPEARLMVNITYKDEIIDIDTKYKSDLSYPARKSKKLPLVVVSSDGVFKFTFSNHHAVRGDYFRHQEGYSTLPEKEIGSSFIQDLGWQGESNIMVENTKNGEVMEISIINVSTLVCLDIDFEKGRFVYDAAKKTLNEMKSDAFMSYMDFKQAWKSSEGSLKHIYLDETVDASSKRTVYKLLNPRDTVFLKETFSDKKGHYFSNSLNLKEKVPAGAYKVYVNKELQMETQIKNK